MQKWIDLLSEMPLATDHDFDQAELFFTGIVEKPIKREHWMDKHEFKRKTKPRSSEDWWDQNN